MLAQPAAAAFPLVIPRTQEPGQYHEHAPECGPWPTGKDRRDRGCVDLTLAETEGRERTTGRIQTGGGRVERQRNETSRLKRRHPAGAIDACEMAGGNTGAILR